MADEMPKLPNGKPKKAWGKIASLILAAVAFYNGVGQVLPHNKVSDSIIVGIAAGLAGLVDPRKKE
jgi:hypothetical protein